MPRKKTGNRTNNPDSNRQPPTRLALTIPEFCEANGFSQSMYFKMKRESPGSTPREMRCGSRILISLESAAEWRAAREAATASDKVSTRRAEGVPA